MSEKNGDLRIECCTGYTSVKDAIKSRSREALWCESWCAANVKSGEILGVLQGTSQVFFSVEDVSRLAYSQYLQTRMEMIALTHIILKTISTTLARKPFLIISILLSMLIFMPCYLFHTNPYYCCGSQ